MQVGLEKRPCAVFDGAAKPPIRLVLVEDHAILREGLKALIELEADFRSSANSPPSTSAWTGFAICSPIS